MNSMANIALAAALATLLFGSGLALPAFADTRENAEFVANVEFIRGHLEKAMENKNAGQIELALAHAGHPVEEVYSLITAPLSESDAALDSELDNALTGLANQIDAMSESDVETATDNINEMLDKAVLAVVGKESDDPAFGAMVVVLLVETAEHEYEEAIEAGQIVQMIEYQDATAFIHRAEVVFANVKPDMPAHEAEEVQELFDQLDSFTASSASPSEVETAIDGIIHELDEVYALGIESIEQLDGWGYIDHIKELLDRAVEEYGEGNAPEARALAVEAYLDNYEYIEGDIAQDDRDLMEKIEVDMREELVQMIDQGRTVSEVEAHVEQIKTDLETARAVVTPEFPLAAIALALAVGGAVAFTRVKTSALGRRA